MTEKNYWPVDHALVLNIFNTIVLTNILEFETKVSCEKKFNFWPSNTVLIHPFVACSSKPCRNGGHCVTSHVGYRCECTAGFTGINCETGTFLSSIDISMSIEKIRIEYAEKLRLSVCDCHSCPPFVNKVEVISSRFKLILIFAPGCAGAMDLVFILDSSGSVQWWNWPKVH